MLTDLLISKRSSIVKNWTSRIFESYASETSSFLSKDKDQFSNPVGFTITENAEKIVDEIISNRDLMTVKILLIDILRIRAVQEFTPSEAVRFVFLLKGVIESELEDHLNDDSIVKELMTLFSFIDEMILMAFDVYMDMREKVHSIRMNEVKYKASGAVQ